MSKFTAKTQLSFEPNVSGVALNVDADTVAHTTAVAWAPTLGDLSFIPYRRALARYKIKTSSLATTGTITVDIIAGGTIKGTTSVVLSAGAEQSGQIAVDLSSVAGETPILARVTVDVEANTGITMSFNAALDIEVPLIVSSC
jgi:hypothetical protein